MKLYATFCLKIRGSQLFVQVSLCSLNVPPITLEGENYKTRPNKQFLFGMETLTFHIILRGGGRGLGWSQLCRDHNYVSKIVMLPP